MNERWLDSQGDDQAAARAETFWAALRNDIDAGAFWADRIKRYRDDPGKRLQTAMDNLPLPAAFREAAVALRTIVRRKRKASEAHEEELGLLYWLAAIESFMLPYAERLQGPGFNVIELIPGNRLRALAVDYLELGYEQLGLLNKTDKKWLVEAWGEPKSHQTLNQIHRELWDQYEDKLIRMRKARDKKLTHDLRDFVKRSGDCTQQHRKKGRTSCLGVVAIVLVTIASVVLGIMTFMEGL